ncbi:hypothetical protein DB346_20730 [Verrucomicrobia bacterium LW23]|nr:hypothetical protein DB346_20730 [Verrucomicrobia bacterium LW23]
MARALGSRPFLGHNRCVQQFLGWYLTICFICAVAAAIFARRRGHEGIDCFYVTLLGSPLLGIPYTLGKEAITSSETALSATPASGQGSTGTATKAAVVSTALSKAPEITRFCPHCSVELPIGEAKKVCPSCGKALAMDALLAMMTGKPVPGNGPEGVGAAPDAKAQQLQQQKSAETAAAKQTARSEAQSADAKASPVAASASLVPEASLTSSAPTASAVDSGAADGPDGIRKSNLRRSWDDPGRYAFNAEDVPRYYVVIEEEGKGPFTAGDLQQMWNMIEIDRTVLYWQDGMEDWHPVGELLEQGVLRPDSTFVPLAGGGGGDAALGQTPASDGASVDTAGFYVRLAADASGNAVGPLSEDEVLEALRGGNLDGDDHVRFPHSSDWVAIHTTGLQAKAQPTGGSGRWLFLLAGALVGAGLMAAMMPGLSGSGGTGVSPGASAPQGGALASGGTTPGPAADPQPAASDGAPQGGAGVALSPGAATPGAGATPSQAGRTGGAGQAVEQELAGFGLRDIRRAHGGDGPAGGRTSGFVYAYASIDGTGREIQQFPAGLYFAEIQGRQLLLFGQAFTVKEAYTATGRYPGTVYVTERDDGSPGGGAVLERLYLFCAPEKAADPATKWPQFTRTQVFSAQRPSIRSVSFVTD